MQCSRSQIIFITKPKLHFGGNQGFYSAPMRALDFIMQPQPHNWMSEKHTSVYALSVVSGNVKLVVFSVYNSQTVSTTALPVGTELQNLGSTGRILPGAPITLSTYCTMVITRTSWSYDNFL